MNLDAPLPRLAEGLRQGEPRVSDYVEAALRRVEQVDTGIASLVPEQDRADRLRREVEAVERRHPAGAERPPLFGVLVGVKDIYRVDGFDGRRLQGSPETFAGEEAEAVRQCGVPARWCWERR
jgi:Asp-tRNA(Asn)/Glu-tRNA(Gln) amidotransferase A subunit family amidase